MSKSTEKASIFALTLFVVGALLAIAFGVGYLVGKILL